MCHPKRGQTNIATVSHIRIAHNHQLLNVRKISIMSTLRSVCLVVFALLLAPVSAAQLTTVDKQSVKVNLSQNTAYEFQVTVDKGKQRFRFASYIPDFESPTEGLQKQRALMGWKGDYLFVRHQCGQMAEWRCIVDQVFTINAGKLIHLGAVESASCKDLGCRYDLEKSTFSDIYDIYQVNPITGQTDTPPLPIIRRAKGNALVTDTDATWARNQTSVEAGMACLNHVAANGFEMPCANNQSPWSALSFIARLTHYTGRVAARDALFANQAVGYCKKSADPKCEWRMEGARDFFQRFDAGAPPRYVPSPVTETSATAASSKDMHEKLPATKAIKLKL